MCRTFPRLLLGGVALLVIASCSSELKPVDQSFLNSLGLEFVPVPGLSVWVCRTETRVKDYALFLRETGHCWPGPGFAQTAQHPAVNVSWLDAKAFCDWLSQPEGRRYRLPTDAEWSVLGGVRPLERVGIAPKDQPPQPERHPWGNRPLSAGDGNLCDETFGKSEFGEGYEARWLSGYNDGYSTTAPVARFRPDAHGIYDLAGNVWEWCEDWYDPPARTLKVLRGASWRTGNPERHWSSYRGPDPPSCRLDSAGFRLVLEPATQTDQSPAQAQRALP